MTGFPSPPKPLLQRGFSEWLWDSWQQNPREEVAEMQVPGPHPDPLMGAAAVGLAARGSRCGCTPTSEGQQLHRCAGGNPLVYPWEAC